MKLESSNVVSLIRNIQQKEGNHDCFQRASGDCDQERCHWRPYCLDDSGGRLPEETDHWPAEC